MLGCLPGFQFSEIRNVQLSVEVVFVKFAFCILYLRYCTLSLKISGMFWFETETGLPQIREKSECFFFNVRGKSGNIYLVREFRNSCLRSRHLIFRLTQAFILFDVLHMTSHFTPKYNYLLILICWNYHMQATSGKFSCLSGEKSGHFFKSWRLATLKKSVYTRYLSLPYVLW